MHAIADTCTHRVASLSEGECDGTEVICPWHGARFDLLTGSALSSPARTGVQVYPVQGVGKEVRVEVP
jgi:nitrite reductase/ring-hydroxylating ferredoxin subunit